MIDMDEEGGRIHMRNMRKRELINRSHSLINDIIIMSSDDYDVEIYHEDYSNPMNDNVSHSLSRYVELN